MTLRLLHASWRSYRARPGRLLLVIGGIACGVALIAALDLINGSVLASFRAMLERTAGKAALQVELGTGEVGFDESTIDAVVADRAVKHAFPMVRGTLHAVDDSGEVLQLFGVDLVSDAIDSYDVRVVDHGNALELLNDPNGVLLARDYATRAGLAVGSRARFATPTGLHELEVRGLLETTGLATVFGGNLAVMDLPSAQRLLGKEGRIDQIDLILDSQAVVADVQHRLAAALPASLSVNRPTTRGERFERAVAAFQAMLDGLSLLCLLAGVFIVFNASATAITERARDLATLLLLGAGPRRIFALVMSEAIALGAIASAIGIGLGIGLAHALSGLVAESMGIIYQVRFPVDALRVGGAQLARYATLGLAGAVVAAIVPARRASRLDPVELMRSDYREQLFSTSNPGLIAAGAFSTVAALGAVYLEWRWQSVAWGNVGASLWWLSGLLLSIPAVGWAAARCQRPLARWYGVPGRVAGAGLLRAPGRTGVTVGVIGLSLTLAVTVASIARSFRESQRDWFILAGDLVVAAVGTEGGWLESPLSGDVGDVLRTVPGVARVETYRALQGQSFGAARIAVVAVSPGFIDTAQFRASIVAGDAEAAVAAIRDDREVIVADNLAGPFGLRPGDEITVPAPAGPTRMRINAIVTDDTSGDRGAIIMHRDRFARHWGGDTQVSRFNVYLSPGTDLQAARTAIVQALKDRYRVKVLTIPQTLAYHQGMVDRAFAFTYAIQLLVIAVTLAGIVDLLTTQIVERRRELGALRLIGAPDAVIARSVWVEALVLGLCGALFGVVISIGTSRIWVHITFPILVGYVTAHHFAFLTAAWCTVLAGAVALLAGRLAARRALREPALDALRFE